MGLVLLYTGDGKGKTTAALGLVLRAVGHGYRVVIAHLMKTLIYRGEYVGEYLAIKKFLGDYVDIYSLDPDQHLTPRDVLRAALDRAREVKPFLLILDEVNNAVANGYLTADEVINGIRSLPPEVNVVLTGRDAPREFMEIADLITIMESRKHYFDRGIVGVRGLEW
ncbi:cob(I)yrinic acid a,c-diamide adenosyltransferase [Vulcanisaeta distributa]|uniref:ATP:corrinoid adenosyltransferase BtuR/CobO/CobP n=1 Tax=Vulcanisaeta distributa (strain DSM 14429 / JCM 11212 / NBRC 100878 / IC-017) TaxID=572478 RepID=E1QPW7_VULDI|nr:cob(I)yrinic acid a,c-diamide adenosyltransferase [Vulcanisaeta distributa]ADN51527.1 ATP:corrinoid adenosyltransferase BtuR/CobO/CobP [Vulcanisaeta distributa DSM 14429]